MDEAEKKLDEFSHPSEDSVDILSNYYIPPMILRQKLYLEKGICKKKLKNYRTAATIFTENLEYGVRFDPQVRKQCLLELKEIFEFHRMYKEAPNIQMLLDSFKRRNKDIIFLLDYSQSMGEGGRISTAVDNILKVFDNYMKPEDRVGFIRFNMNCDIIFTLAEKKRNTIQLRRQFEDSLKPSGGTALYSALMEAMRLFQKADPRENTQWIIALTDGDDNESRVSFEQTFKKLARSDVNLIIIGLALHASIIPKLSYLCKSTKEGLFIESVNTNSLDMAFQAASDIIYGNEFNVENITV